MQDILLRELTNAELDWMITQGRQTHLSLGQMLLSPADAQADLHLLIEGRLRLRLVPDEKESLNCQVEGIDALEPGELVGLAPLLDGVAIEQVSALEPSLMLSLPLGPLRAKLRQDTEFAAHFYRSAAITLSHRLRRIFEHPDQLHWQQSRSTREVLSVFGELQDSDIDWLTSFGEPQRLEPGTVLLQAGRPVDALYVVLEGGFAITAPPSGFNPLKLCFYGLDESTRHQSILTQIGRGALPGIISCLDFSPLPVTIRSQQASVVLAVPRSLLVTKLTVDAGFASRFYRIIARQILELLHTVSCQLACEQIEADGTARPEELEAAMEDSEHLDLDSLQTLSEGAAKFDWMRQQLGVHRG